MYPTWTRWRVFLLLAWALDWSRARDYWHGLPGDGDVQDFVEEAEVRQALFDPQEGSIQRQHVFLGVYDGTRPEECSAPLHKTFFTLGTLQHADIDLVGVARVARQAIPGLLAEAGAQVDGCVSVLYLPLGGTPKNMVVTPPGINLEKSYMAWVGARLRVPLTIRNRNETATIKVYWLGEGRVGKERHLTLTLQPGSEGTIESYVGHIFLAREAATDKLLDYATVKKAGAVELGSWTAPSCDLQGGAQACEDPETSMLRYAYGAWYRSRVAMNGIQPTRVERLTTSGFERHRLPEDIYRPLKDFWDKYRDEAQMEHLVGPAVNQLDVPTYVIHYPDKQQLFDGIKPMLSAWSGKDNLFPTSCYGIRKYTDGSRLLMHVDTIESHVVSAIINVDQKVREDWPLLIMGHDNQLHNVTMAPGDIVFYESSRLLHGRPTALQGEYYANIFVHFSFPEWNPLPL